jgi:hypothetical protein
MALSFMCSWAAAGVKARVAARIARAVASRCDLNTVFSFGG